MRLKSYLLLCSGCLCLGVGAVGLLLPVLPTTPFVLLAAGCFGSTSPRLYALLARNRYFGAYIANYKSGTGVARAVKVRSLLFLWGMLALSMAAMDVLPARLLLALVGCAVSAHILCIKTQA